MEAEENKSKAEKYDSIKDKAEKFDLINNFEQTVSENKLEIEKTESELKRLSQQINPYIEYLELSDCSHFRALYKYAEIEKYADALKMVLEAQKIMIKSNTALLNEVLELDSTDLIKNLKKLTLSALNSECDSIIRMVTYNNVESCKTKIAEIGDRINKILEPFRMSIQHVLSEHL